MASSDGTQLPISPQPAPPAPPPSAGIQIEYLDPRLAPRRGFSRGALRSPWFWPISAASNVVLGYILLAGFAAGVAALSSSRWMSGGASLVGLLLLVATARLLHGIRANRARMVLSYLEQAVRLNLPLPAMLRAAESAEAGGPRRAIQRVRARLEEGYALSRALEESESGVSPRTLGLVDAGERAGRPGAALRRLIEQDRAATVRDPTNAIFIRWYPLILTVGVGGAWALMVIRVLPKYRQILTDFHRPVPPAMTWLSIWGDTIFLVASIALCATLLIFAGRMTATIFAPRLRRPAILGLLIDPVLWHLPLVGGVARGRGLADVCAVLTDALDAGYAPASALADAANLSLNAVLRRRVRRWKDCVEAGVPLADAARVARMPGLLAGMLSSASGEDVPRVLQFLARYYESRFSRASEILRGAIVPVMVVGFGAMVLLMAYTLLVPLMDLVDTMCSQLNKGRL